MKNFLFLLAAVAALSSCTSKESDSTAYPTDTPIQLHPENPHYFLYNGEALALVTSAEHYGAVLNLDFDYKLYLETLAADGMNYTRIFSGSYFEIAGESFGIQKNSLAPQKDRIITPWTAVGTNESGYPTYDLNTWNPAYFERLHNFMSLAAGLDIIVEVTLFSSIYRDGHWDISPQNPANNINLDGAISRLDAQTPDNGALFAYQASFVKKMVAELNDFDNFFFEIQNEPWADHAVAAYNIVNKEELVKNDWTYKTDLASQRALDWQEMIAEEIVKAEQALPQKHLIAQNYCNFKAPIAEVSEHIDILNFHYAWPEAVEWNLHFDRVIGFDESGFAGSEDQVYRRQAWKFMLSGGGLFNSLDYSFFPGHEDGLGKNSAPGGGSKTLRKQLKVLSDFLHSFELEKMHPDKNSIKRAPGLIPYVLSDPGTAYALYLRAIGTTEAQLELNLPDGSYTLRTLNTLDGSYNSPQDVNAKDGVLTLDLAIPEGEIAISLVKK